MRSDDRRRSRPFDPRAVAFAMLAALGLATACSDPGSGEVEGFEEGDAETPPTGAEAVDAWLAEGAYLDWACEPEPHPPRNPSAHGDNRICSNQLLSEHGSGPYPIGASAVKELHEGGEIRGYAVYRRIADGDGESWYWFERTENGLVADGPGTSGAPRDTCASCHSAAGSDNAHSGHDYVYTQVR